MKVSADTFTFRAGVPGDAHLLLSTWLKSYRNSSVAMQIPNKVYFECHQDLIVQILGTQGTEVTVICSKDDPDQILGYAVYNSMAPILHYVYVKYPFRKLGLGKLLVSMVQNLHGDKALHCTHIAKDWKSKMKAYRLVYNPYFLGVNSGSAVSSSEAP